MSSFTRIAVVTHEQPCGCLPPLALKVLAPLAERAATQVTGRRRTRVTSSVLNTAVPDADPLVEAQTERALGVLSAVVHCDAHRPAGAAASTAIHRRVSQAALAYLGSDAAHRHTTGQDLLRVLSWAIGDHARTLTAGTPATSRPDRRGAQLLHRLTGNRLLTDVQVEILVYLSRGVMRARGHHLCESGEPLAAQIVLRRSTAHDAVAYLRGVAASARRGPVAAGVSTFDALDDAQLLTALQSFTDIATWRDGDRAAQLTWVWLSTRASEILGASLAEAGDDPDHPNRQLITTQDFFGHADDALTLRSDELELWERIAEDGYRLGRRQFTTTERAKIAARIQQLRDAGFGG